jgi:hypothetical protein
MHLCGHHFGKDDSVFPEPEKQADTGRPYYRKDLQQVCLDVRRRNCGVNGKPVLFYARRLSTALVKSRTPKQKLVAQRGDRRVLRGGSWNNNGHLCRSARRNKYPSDFTNDNIGFRVVLLV